MKLMPSHHHFFPSTLGSCYRFVYLMFLLLMIPSSSSLVNADVICPPAADYAPCLCGENRGRPGTVYLYCYNQNLTDSQMSGILDAFLTTPGVSPLGYLSMWQNQLTRVPTQIKSFNQLDAVYIYENSIASIGSGAFNFPDAANPVRDLSLYYNQLTTIAPGAFRGQQNKFVHASQLTNESLIKLNMPAQEMVTATVPGSICITILI